MNIQVFKVLKRFIHNNKISNIPKLSTDNLVEKKRTNRKKRKIHPKPMGNFNNLSEVVKARKNFMKVVRKPNDFKF